MKIKLNLNNIIKQTNNMNFESMSKKEIEDFCSENEIEVPEEVTKKSQYIKFLTENFDFEEEEEIIEIEEDVEEEEEDGELVNEVEEEDMEHVEDILNISSVDSEEVEEVVEEAVEEEEVLDLNLTIEEEGVDEEPETIELVEEVEVEDDEEQEQLFTSKTMLMTQMQVLMNSIQSLYTPDLTMEEVSSFTTNDDGKRTTYSDMNVQTDTKEFVDQEAQVQPEVCEVEVQTETKKITESQTQTIVKKIHEIGVQTDTIKETTLVIKKAPKKVKACSIKKCNGPRETKSKFCAVCNQKIRDGKIKIKSKK